MNPVGLNNKTLYSSVEAKMMDDILAFHQKGNLMVDTHFRNSVTPYAINLSQLKQLEKSDFEIIPFHDKDISCDSESFSTVRRDRSAQSFSAKKIHLATIKRILQDAFVKTKDGSRPYPSGGALYPIEVICVMYQERIVEKNAINSGFYHYRPTLNALQPLKEIPSEKIRDVIYQMELEGATDPAFSLIYLANVTKMLVKYRYRGYRYALMEAGAMFQQADLVAGELGIRNKLYSGFNDAELIQLLSLDKLNFLPLVVQSFGGEV